MTTIAEQTLPATPRPAETPTPGVIAAVDLGSNSFHMVVARWAHDGLVILDRIREMVRLGAGLDSRGNLSQEAMDRALDCLGRFSERLNTMHADDVRIVGTNTLRKARNRDDFLGQAAAVLGHQIDIISGVEEARLVYAGATHSLPRFDGGRLVVDIGGGSTELIVGQDNEPRQLESLYMGCVSVSRRFFPEGKVEADAFRRARLFARRELEPVIDRYQNAGWEQAIGTSGTIRATSRILAHLGGTSGEISLAGLQELGKQLVSGGSKNSLKGLSDERAPVFPGGVAILTEVFEALGVESMTVASGALREGLLYDQVGRLTDEDARERTVRSLQERFHADRDQARRVALTATRMLEQVADAWDLRNPNASLLLRWAAALHEIGLDIAHAKHSRHAAYLLAYADMAGFSTGAQHVLSGMVGNQRRKFRKEMYEGVPPQWQERALRMTVLLRLAVLLRRSRRPMGLPEISVQADGEGLVLEFPPQWLEEHPLTQADLEQERDYLDAVGVSLGFR